MQHHPNASQPREVARMMWHPRNRSLHHLTGGEKTMRRARVVACSGLVLFCSFLLPLLNSRPAPQAQAAPASEQSAPFFISCSTAGGAGIDTYFTGVFQTELKWKTLKGPGSG